MPIPRPGALVLAAALFLPTGPAHAGEDKIAIRTDLQITMQRYVDRSMIDGAIFDLDEATGTVRKLFPVEAHPMIMVGDGYFVLCADLVTESGEVFEVDYYVTETPRGFRVFATEIDNRDMLRDLVAAGAVAEY